MLDLLLTSNSAPLSRINCWTISLQNFSTWHTCFHLKILSHGMLHLENGKSGWRPELPSTRREKGYNLSTNIASKLKTLDAELRSHQGPYYVSCWWSWQRELSICIQWLIASVTTTDALKLSTKWQAGKYQSKRWMRVTIESALEDQGDQNTELKGEWNETWAVRAHTPYTLSMQLGYIHVLSMTFKYTYEGSHEHEQKAHA